MRRKINNKPVVAHLTMSGRPICRMVFADKPAFDMVMRELRRLRILAVCNQTSFEDAERVASVVRRFFPGRPVAVVDGECPEYAEAMKPSEEENDDATENA